MTTSMVGLKNGHIYAKISPRMVNLRDIVDSWETQKKKKEKKKVILRLLISHVNVQF